MDDIKIAVCDDVESERLQLMESIREIWENAEVYGFGDGQQVLQNIQRGMGYDLVFLDIYMEQMGGLDAGKWIHDNFPEIQMVFISNSREFGPEIFELNALHYLVKPYNREALEEVKQRFHDRQGKERVLSLQNRQTTQDIPFQRISYIESVHNNLLIHLITGAVIKIRGSLGEFAEGLDNRFIRINRGIVVNMDVIEKMHIDSCEIAGMTFMLSRKKRTETRKKYYDYLFESAMYVNSGVRKR